MSGRRPLCAVVTGLAAAPVLALSPPSDPPARRDGEPSASALCAFGLIVVEAEHMRRCQPGRDPALLRFLEDASARLERRILAQPGVTQEQVDRFKRDQAYVGADRDRLCSISFPSRSAADIARFQREVGIIVARPGPVEAGDCV